MSSSSIQQLGFVRNSALLAINLTDLPIDSPYDSSRSVLIRNDLLSILALLHQSVTKVSLALNPTNPSYPASLAPLKDIADRVAALAHCVRLFRPHHHGLTLIDEAKSLVKQVLESIHALAQALLDVHTANTNRSPASGQPGNEYMIRTAAVHDLIDKARSSSGTEGLSVDNMSAVRKRWLRDQASLDDGLQELGEMIDSNDSEEDFGDDGWDELGLDTKKLSAPELERAKKVQVTLRFSTLLHKRVARDLLSSTYSADFNLHLDALPQHSSTLLVASDELVACMYGPQNEQNVATELDSFKNVIRNLQSSIAPLLDQNDKAKRWFTTCFDQILK